MWQCPAIPPPIRFARHSIASEAETQNHQKRERSGRKQGSTATPSKSVALSETMYPYRSASVQVIWSVGNVVPIMFLSDPSTLSMPCLKLYPNFPFFPFVGGRSVGNHIVVENLTTCKNAAGGWGSVNRLIHQCIDPQTANANTRRPVSNCLY